MKFVFKNTPELMKLLQHCTANQKHYIAPYSGGEWGPEKPAKGPTVMLVNDDGVYLMSPFTRKGAPKTARLTNGTKDKNGNKMFVVYANNHGPGTHIGGDDFGENIPIPSDIDKGFKTLEISVSETSIRVTTTGEARSGPVETEKEFYRLTERYWTFTKKGEGTKLWYVKDPRGRIPIPEVKRRFNVDILLNELPVAEGFKLYRKFYKPAK
jgi:hypothetical protein